MKLISLWLIIVQFYIEYDSAFLSSYHLETVWEPLSYVTVCGRNQTYCMNKWWTDEDGQIELHLLPFTS